MSTPKPRMGMPPVRLDRSAFGAGFRAQFAVPSFAGLEDEPHATSHDALDDDEGVQGEVRNAARTLLAAVAAHRRASSGT